MLRSKKGFTLIELLIVVVIIGILAAIAIPKFAQTKQKAYIAAMKSDLRNLATSEESLAADSGGVYSSSLTSLGVTPSQNVTLAITTTTNPNGWTATATHALASNPKTCTMNSTGLITCP